jgi:lipopolysaccharide biosynthesis glycosyltransferase
MSDKVRVFIGSGEASRLERKTLVHSLRKNSKRELDIYVFNGTHNAVERNDDPPFDAGLPLHIKYRNYTEFSNYRFLIPQLCGFQGRAIWLDSDMICLGDIGELFDTDLGGNHFLAKAEAYKKNGDAHWALSVMLIDCAKCQFETERYFQEMDSGAFANIDLHEMTPKFLAHHPFKIGKLDPNWNVFDEYNDQTKLIHYTDLRRQPWKFPGHTYGDLWYRYFQEARQAGLITPRDIEITTGRAYARQDIGSCGTSKQPRETIAMAGAQPKKKGLGRKLQRLWDKIRGRKRAA